MQQAANAYINSSINITSQVQLVEMMYQGIIKFCNQAKKSVDDEDFEKQSYWINRVIDIFFELISTLNNKDGNSSDLCEYLEGLYKHQVKILTEANIQSDADKIDEVIKVTKGLIEAWREVN